MAINPCSVFLATAMLTSSAGSSRSCSRLSPTRRPARFWRPTRSPCLIVWACASTLRHSVRTAFVPWSRVSAPMRSRRFWRYPRHEASSCRLAPRCGTLHFPAAHDHDGGAGKELDRVVYLAQKAPALTDSTRIALMDQGFANVPVRVDSVIDDLRERTYRIAPFEVPLANDARASSDLPPTRVMDHTTDGCRLWIGAWGAHAKNSCALASACARTSTSSWVL